MKFETRVTWESGRSVWHVFAEVGGTAQCCVTDDPATASDLVAFPDLVADLANVPEEFVFEVWRAVRRAPRL